MISFYLAMAPTATQEGAAAQPGWTSFLPFLILMVLMYFVMIRPHSKRQKEHEAMLKAVKTGDKVVVAGGILGTVSNVKDTTILVKVDEGVKIEVQKAAVVSIEKEKSNS
ncbi:MAG: preprotein translocase subunit YajC [Verrucomicrobiota bacterium]